MPALFSVSVDKVEEDRVRAVLDPKQYRQAIFQAVLRTTKKIGTAVGKGIKEHSYIKPKYIKRSIFVRVPKNKSGDVSPEGTVEVKKKRLPLIAFKVRASKKRGVTVQTSPDGAPIVLRHAFKATVRLAGTSDEHEGHDGIFLRARHLPSKGPHVGKGKLTKRGFAGRFAIAEQFGPSAFFFASLPEVKDSIVIDARAEMRKQLTSQVARFKGTATAPPAAEA